MSHEHFPGCGHEALPHEHGHEHHHDHHDELAHHAGSLCCQGQCSHPEHQGNPLFETQIRSQLEAQEKESDDDEVVDPRTGKKVKRRDLRRQTTNFNHQSKGIAA